MLDSWVQNRKPHQWCAVISYCFHKWDESYGEQTVIDYVTSQGPGSRNLHVADHDNKRGCLPSPWAFWTPGILFTQMSVEGLAATTELTNRLLGQLLFGTGWEIPYKMNNWLSCLWRSTGPGADPNVLLCTGTMEAALQRSSYDPQNRGSAQLLFQAGRASREHICQNPHTSPRECVQILSGVPLQCEELFAVLTSLNFLVTTEADISPLCFHHLYSEEWHAMITEYSNALVLYLLRENQIRF